MSKRKSYKKKYKILDENCKGCVHYSTLGHCDYIGDENKRRPCPGGDECTVKQIGKRIVRKYDIVLYEGYDPEEFYYSTDSYY